MNFPDLGLANTLPGLSPFCVEEQEIKEVSKGHRLEWSKAVPLSYTWVELSYITMPNCKGC